MTCQPEKILHVPQPCLANPGTSFSGTCFEKLARESCRENLTQNISEPFPWAVAWEREAVREPVWQPYLGCGNLNWRRLGLLRSTLRLLLWQKLSVYFLPSSLASVAPGLESD